MPRSIIIFKVMIYLSITFTKIAINTYEIPYTLPKYRPRYPPVGVGIVHRVVPRVVVEVAVGGIVYPTLAGKPAGAFPRTRYIFAQRRVGGKPAAGLAVHVARPVVIQPRLLVLLLPREPEGRFAVIVICELLYPQFTVWCVFDMLVFLPFMVRHQLRAPQMVRMVEILVSYACLNACVVLHHLGHQACVPQEDVFTVLPAAPGTSCVPAPQLVKI
jgi:hypothetical protein